MKTTSAYKETVLSLELTTQDSVHMGTADLLLVHWGRGSHRLKEGDNQIYKLKVKNSIHASETGICIQIGIAKPGVLLLSTYTVDWSNSWEPVQLPKVLLLTRPAAKANFTV